MANCFEKYPRTRGILIKICAAFFLWKNCNLKLATSQEKDMKEQLTIKCRIKKEEP